MDRLCAEGYRVYGTVLDIQSVGAQRLHDLFVAKKKMVVHSLDVIRDEDIEDYYHKLYKDLVKNECYLWAVVNNIDSGVMAQLEWVCLDHIKQT